MNLEEFYKKIDVNRERTRYFWLGIFLFIIGILVFVGNKHWFSCTEDCKTHNTLAFLGGIVSMLLGISSFGYSFLKDH